MISACPECGPNHYCTFHHWVYLWTAYLIRCNAIRARLFPTGGSFNTTRIKQFTDACDQVAKATILRIPREERELPQWEAARRQAETIAKRKGFRL